MHNQSAEQMERLKPRIQMHYVRKKTGTVESKLPPEKKLQFAANKNKSEKVSFMTYYTDRMEIATIVVHY